MKNITKSNDGFYHVKGLKCEKLIGSRAQVWHGTAYKTSGGLTKTHLMKNKSGRIVSHKKHHTAKKEKRLLKHGYGFTKGKFVASRKHTKKHRKGGAIYSLGSNASVADNAEHVSGMGTPPMSGQRTLPSDFTGPQNYATTAGGGAFASDAGHWDSKNWGSNQLTTPGGLTNYYDSALGSAALQIKAGMYGGKRRKSSKKNRKSRR